MSDFDSDDPFSAYEERLSTRAMPGVSVPYLDVLNPAQREAVETLDGPLLVLAGAGTGKTRVLTTRLAHLLNQRRARPDEVLAVTFTNKAAREMRERIGGLIGYQVEGMPWLGTFHSVSARILRRHAELVDLKSNFTILDSDDQLRLLKQLVRADNIDEKRWPARLLAGYIDQWKNRGWLPEHVPEQDGAHYANGRGRTLYAEYQLRLKTLNAVDFGDLLLHLVSIFQKHSDVLARYQERFRYVLVDEYQDTNVAQYLWLRLLAAGRRNICCVGDDDQSIYGWRGAEVGNILNFERDFEGAKIVRLEQNYRSTPQILAAASAVIAGNEERLGKTLWTEAPAGGQVRLMGLWDGEEEARWIGEEIEALQRGTRGHPPLSLDEMAVLVRASHQMRAFEDRFLMVGLPYRVIGGPRFYERMEIRDAIAYLRLIAQPDDGLAFERIANTPRRGVGDKAMQTIQSIARDMNVSVPHAAQTAVDQGALSGKAKTSMARLMKDFERWRSMVMRADAKGELTHSELAEIVLDESGYTAMWMNDKSPDAPGRLENLKELVRSMGEFENLTGFLEHISLVMDNEGAGGEEKVSIMTLHAAKGLEYQAVFLPGWEDGLFPSSRSMDENGRKGLEEERRLAYVGLTRAREFLTVSFAANRRVYNQWQSQLPSRFIDELPKEAVEVLTSPGLYGGAYGGAAPTIRAQRRTHAKAAEGFTDLEQQAAGSDVYQSPGWRRMQQQQGNGGYRQPQIIDARAIPSFAIGERVFHRKFGYGMIEDIDGDKCTVEFEKAGSKRIVSAYLKPADSAGDVPF